MTDDTVIPSSDELVRIRERLGLTQAEAAAKVGVARRTWMYWENPARKRRPSKAHAKLIALMVAEKI